MTATFFRVSSASSPAPFAGDPPLIQWTDTSAIKATDEPDDKPLEFSFDRPRGYYYLGISVIAYMERGPKMVAQVERFFPMTQPCQIQSGKQTQLELIATWPDIPLDQLNYYGTVRPQKS